MRVLLVNSIRMNWSALIVLINANHVRYSPFAQNAKVIVYQYQHVIVLWDILMISYLKIVSNAILLADNVNTMDVLTVTPID